MSEHHWRSEFNSNYLGSHHFTKGQDMILTIKSVKPESVMSTDGDSERRMVARWVEDQLPWIMNKTNCRTVARLLKENDYTKWTGERIQLYVDHKVKAFGELVDGVRVRKQLPETKAIKCESCGKDIKPAYSMTVAELAKYTRDKYGKTICAECAKKEAAKNEADQ